MNRTKLPHNRRAKTALGYVAQLLRCWTVVQEVQGLIPTLTKIFLSLIILILRKLK